MAGTKEEAPVSGWQLWLLPPRPGYTHFLLVAACLVLPVAAMGLGSDRIIPAMAVSAVVGGGLGVGWLLACGKSWLRQAPVTSLCVLIIGLGCLGHLYIMPRWEVMLRVQAAREDLRFYLEGLRVGRAMPVPTYDAGPSRQRFRLLDPGAVGSAVIAYTPEPLQRWTPFGTRDSCYVVLRGDGEVRMVRDRAELDRALAAR
jgi:hypothetical protein